MAVKAFALLTAKPGLSRDEYLQHYEEVHKVIGCGVMTGALAYRRNHVVADGAMGGVPEFSTLTEFWFRDRAAFDATMGVFGEARGAPLAADEENLFDRAQTKMFLVEETGPDQSRDVVEDAGGRIDPGQRIRQYYATYNSGDAAELAAFYAEDVVLMSPNGTIAGRDALLSTYSRLQENFLDVMAIERMMVAGSVVFVDVLDVLTARRDVADFYGMSVRKGEQVRFRIAGTYALQQDEIRQVTLYFN